MSIKQESIRNIKSSYNVGENPTFTQKIYEQLNSSLPSGVIRKINSPKNRVMRSKFNLFRKKIEFLDISSGNLIPGKKRYLSSCAVTIGYKPLPSIIRKKTNHYSIKTLEYYIKQKILDISTQIEKDELNFSEFENNNNSSKVAKSFSCSNKLIKKLYNESGNDSSSYTPHKKDEKKTNDLSSFKKVSNSDNYKKDAFKRNKEKIFRKIEKKIIIYDSMDDSDIFDERGEIGFNISSNKMITLIFDSSIILCTLFDVIYTPFRLSSTICFCKEISKNIKFIYAFIDLLYIGDLLCGFFRTYYYTDSKKNKDNETKIRYYLTNQFILDFLQAFPFFSIILFLCKNNNNFCSEYSFSPNQTFLLLCCYIKQLKIIKILNKNSNSITKKIIDFFSEKYYIEEKFNFIKWCIICIYVIYSFISLHIFIGHQSYQNWIISVGLQNKNYFSLYISSFYFLMATVSTVGYGDIVCKSTIEICFQAIFLSVGVCVYSWIVSYLGNYIQNHDHAENKYDEDEGLLEEIRIAYPEMPFKLYHQILQHLKSRKLRQQKCDANILINSLPFSFRNHLLLTMYKQTTDRLKICKNCHNSDFIIKLLTSFIPIFSKKNSLIIHEGELIESIVFINDGRLALEASIDIEFPGHSVYQYLYVKFRDINDILGNTVQINSSSTGSHINFHNFIEYKRAESFLDKVINKSNSKCILASNLDETSIGRQIGKYDYDGNFEESNYKYINIVNILKNESYGSVYMFLDKPSPLSLRVKSKKAELFLLRKFNAFSISRLHPNIWKRFQKKAYLNMISVKNMTIKIIKDYSKINGITPVKNKHSKKNISGITSLISWYKKKYTSKE